MPAGLDVIPSGDAKMTSTLRNPRVLFVLRGYPLGGKRTSDVRQRQVPASDGPCSVLQGKGDLSERVQAPAPRLGVYRSVGERHHPSRNTAPARPHLHLRGYLVFVLVFISGLRRTISPFIFF